MSKYTTLLFDADATLMDFHRSEHEAVTECLEFFGLPSDDSVIKKYSEINAGYWKMLERGEIEKEKLYSLPIWEGDKIFLRLLDENIPFFSLKLTYEGDHLLEAVLNGEVLG
mgnify:CR=1 FL=1